MRSSQGDVRRQCHDKPADQNRRGRSTRGVAIHRFPLDRRQILLSTIIEGTAATSGLESGQRRPHQRNRFLVALMSRSAIVLYVSTPQIIRHWQATACPRAARKSATYRSPRSSILAALVPSVGTITLQIELRSRAGAMNARASEHCRRTAASHRRAKLYKFERHNDRPLLHQ
jgi:hypothetical protein